jgi:hypothetical protein
MRLFAATLFLLSALDGAAAAQQSTVGVIMGAGMTSCAEFAKLFRRNPNATESYYFFWAQGFMSGSNLMLLALKQPMHDLAAWSIHDQEFRIRQYCEQSPLSDYAHAVGDLFKALPEIPRSAK